MKKSLFLLAAAITGVAAQAQSSLDDGIKMVKYERYKTAEQVLQPLAINPTANYYLGLAQLGEGNEAAARATFSKYPEDPANMAGMARLAFLDGKPDEGLRIANAVSEKAKKKDWQPIVFAADAINYGSGGPQAAIDLYKKALTRGDNVDVRIGLGDAYQKLQGGGGEAMNNYESATTQDAKNSLGYSRIGKLWYDAKNYSDAIINWQKAKDVDPKNPLPYRDMANAYFYVNKMDLAKQNVEQYYALSDKTCDDKIQYADILFLAKDFTTALSQMHDVLTTCKDKPYMYRVLARSYFETKDYPNALQYSRIFFDVQKDPKKILPDDYKYIARTFAMMKQADSARFYFEKAIASDTSSDKKKIYVEVAENYKSLNNDTAYAIAAEYYGKAVQSAGANAVALDYFWWGVMKYYAKDYNGSAEVFQQMETKFPDEPSATYWRARVAAAQDNEGKTGAAVPFFQKWLAIPDSDKYKKKPSDITLAYDYLAIVAYNKNDKTAVREYIEKIKQITPAGDAMTQQLESILNRPAPKASPAKKK